jgi:hypothetical protein
MTRETENERLPTGVSGPHPCPSCSHFPHLTLYSTPPPSLPGAQGCRLSRPGFWAAGLPLQPSVLDPSRSYRLGTINSTDMSATPTGPTQLLYQLVAVVNACCHCYLLTTPPAQVREDGATRGDAHSQIPSPGIATPGPSAEGDWGRAVPEP